jgi:hypothetical protein
LIKILAYGDDQQKGLALMDLNMFNSLFVQAILGYPSSTIDAIADGSYKRVA